MKKSVLEHIKTSKKESKKLLAILLDPDKIKLDEIPEIINKINASSAHFIFVGGSTVAEHKTGETVEQIKSLSNLPVVIFPGDYTQITNKADALLFLSLLSGRNPEFLIEQQIKSVEKIEKTSLEVIPTGYILVDGGVETAVQKVSKTKPISQKNEELILKTALAGQFLGKQLIYLEAGSGAKKSVSEKIIRLVAKNIEIPLIIGGGIRTKKQLENAYKNGADLVVIGTAFEENTSILKNL